MKVYIVGTGMEGRDTLTAAAERVISEADVLIGAERMTAPYRREGRRIVNACLPGDIAAALKKADCDSAAVLLSGDTGFFSGAKKLPELLEEHDTEIVCGISTPVYFCSRLGISYERMKYVSLHGRHGNIAINVRTNEKCFFLLGGNVAPGELCRTLCRFGLSEVTVHIGEELGGLCERIRSGRAEEFTEITAEKLCAVITENPAALGYIPCGIDDSGFIRGKVPMTKKAVRENIVSGLCIERDSVCWDIGCGTGSVSVEMAFRCPDGMVYSFDKSPEACGLTSENADKWGCDNITVIAGSCPEALEDAPVPDKVFVGGSSGTIREIFRIVHSVNPESDITVSAVTLETLSLAAEVFREYGTEPEILQLSAAETHRVGNYTMLRGTDPVFIIRGRLV